MQKESEQTASLPPEHVAIIMDGNGRWAAARKQPRQFGHHQGVEAVRRCVEAAGVLGIRYLTLYSFSTENWQRPEDEVKALFDLMKRFVDKDLDKLQSKGVRVRILGARDNLGADIIALIKKAESRTQHNDKMCLNIAFNYGGRDEIIRACSALIAQVRAGDFAGDTITEMDIASRLDTAAIPDPDLVLRTSGEQRLSNFLLWQSAYSEFVVLDVFWPDFEQKHFEEALQIYSTRNRRKGRACV